MIRPTFVLYFLNIQCLSLLSVVVPTSATTLWIASPGDQFLLVMKLKRLYISCINTNIVICWTELQLT